jgi:hypothetical protein
LFWKGSRSGGISKFLVLPDAIAVSNARDCPYCVLSRNPALGEFCGEFHGRNARSRHPPLYATRQMRLEGSAIRRGLRPAALSIDCFPSLLNALTRPQTAPRPVGRQQGTLDNSRVGRLPRPGQQNRRSNLGSRGSETGAAAGVVGGGSELGRPASGDFCSSLKKSYRRREMAKLTRGRRFIPHPELSVLLPGSQKVT